MATFGVIGLGQLGTAVSSYLAENGADVIAIDRNIDRVEALKDHVGRALCLDTTDEKALRASGISECSTVVLALGEGQLEEAVLATMLLRQLAVGRIVSRASTDVQGLVLERLGVSKIVFPERQIGLQIARQLLAPTVHDILPMSTGGSIAELVVPERLAGQTLQQIGLRPKFGLNAVELRRKREVARDDGAIDTEWEIDNTPGGDTEVAVGDILVVVGQDDKIRAFAET